MMHADRSVLSHLVSSSSGWTAAGQSFPSPSGLPSLPPLPVSPLTLTDPTFLPS